MATRTEGTGDYGADEFRADGVTDALAGRVIGTPDAEDGGG